MNQLFIFTAVLSNFCNNFKHEYACVLFIYIKCFNKLSSELLASFSRLFVRMVTLLYSKLFTKLMSLEEWHFEDERLNPWRFTILKVYFHRSIPFFFIAIIRTTYQLSTLLNFLTRHNTHLDSQYILVLLLFKKEFCFLLWTERVSWNHLGCTQIPV